MLCRCLHNQGLPRRTRLPGAGMGTPGTLEQARFALVSIALQSFVARGCTDAETIAQGSDSRTFLSGRTLHEWGRGR
jgi:hypothetical protein